VKNWRASINRRLGGVLRRTTYAIHNIRDAYDAFIPPRSETPTRTPDGFNLVGGRSQHHRHMQEGKFEEAEMSCLRRAISDCSVFVDVGANIGLYTCMARAAGKRVLAIEPQRQNLKYLFTNIQSNGWTDVEVYPVGVANTPGLATMYGASSTGASLVRGWAGATDRYKSTIALSTLDIIIGKRFTGEQILVKIDVEGAELRVLQGAMDVLQMSPRPTWFVEITLDEFHKDQNTDYEKIFEIFWNHGYSCQLADLPGTPVSPEDVKRWIASRRTDTGVFNYLFR